MRSSRRFPWRPRRRWPPSRTPTTRPRCAFLARHAAPCPIHPRVGHIAGRRGRAVHVFFSCLLIRLADLRREGVLREVLRPLVWTLVSVQPTCTDRISGQSPRPTRESVIRRDRVSSHPAARTHKRADEMSLPTTHVHADTGRRSFDLAGVPHRTISAGERDDATAFCHRNVRPEVSAKAL